MPSEFDALARLFCVPVIQEAFGERDETDGSLASVVCYFADGTERTLLGCVLGALRSDPEAVTELGSHQRDELSETVTLHVPRCQEWGKFTPQHEASYAIPALPGSRSDERFYLEAIESLTDSWANLRLVRTVVQRIQRGRVER